MDKSDLVFTFSHVLEFSAGTGVLEAERHFRKVAGYRALPRLAAMLHAHDAARPCARS
jgi:hypothetical protein